MLELLALPWPVWFYLGPAAVCVSSFRSGSAQLFLGAPGQSTPPGAGCSPSCITWLLFFSCISFIVHHTTPHMHTSTHWLKVSYPQVYVFCCNLRKRIWLFALAVTTVVRRHVTLLEACVCFCLRATGGGAISTPQTAGLDLTICFLTLTHTHKYKHTHTYFISCYWKGGKKQMEKEAPKRDRDNLIFQSMSPPIISSMKPVINPNVCSCFKF